MKKIFTNFFTILLVCCIITTFFCTPALAANGNVYFSDPSATVGSTVNVSMTVGDDVSSYRLTLSYDSSKLKYVGASSSDLLTASGGDGYISLFEYNATSSGTFNCTLTFTAIAAGSAYISVSSYDMTDDNGDSVAGHIGSSTVTISNPATASSDATLSSLSISPGYLSPSFSSGTTYYTTTVSSDTTKLTVSATPNDSGAYASVSGTSLSVGSNYVYVTVTAEDGTEKTYTIVVTRPAATVSGGSENNTTGTPETDIPETPTEAYVTTASGTILRVSEEIDETLIPKGFTITETTIDGIKVAAIKYGDTDIIAVLLLNEDDTANGLYFLNKDNIGTPMTTLNQPTGGIILADLSLVTVPNGYKTGKFKIGDNEYDVFIPDSVKEPDHCLVCGINAEGESDIYCYDPVEGTFQRYGLSSVVKVKEVEVEVPVEPASPADSENTANKDDTSLLSFFKDKRILYISIVVVVVIALLIALCVILYVMYSRKNKACISMATRKSYTATTTSEE